MGKTYNMEFLYNVDIVLCIDASACMSELIEDVKEKAIRLPEDVRKRMEEIGRKVNMRVRCIEFRDYGADGPQGMLATDFLSLPEKQEEFSVLINSIEAHGGGDLPKDAFEALAHAMRSDWVKEGSRKRHIIALWTNAPAYPLGFSASKYPAYNSKNFPKNFDELTELWKSMESSKRMVVFGPQYGSAEDSVYWDQLAHCGWDNLVIFYSQAGNGLSEVDYRCILNALVTTL